MHHARPDCRPRRRAGRCPMTRLRRTALAAASAASLCCWAVPGDAQQNGVRNGKDMQPTEGGVRASERAAGVAPTPQRQEQEQGAVSNLYKQLMGNERQSGLSSAPTNPNAPFGPNNPAPPK